MNQPLDSFRFVVSFVLGGLRRLRRRRAGRRASGSSGPIVIGTSNSLTGALAPFELAINGGMEVAADEINADGGVDGRPLAFIHVDAKSDLNLSATATLEAIEKGADVVVPICDADLGGPGARAANEKGVLAITCAGAPGLGRQTIGPLTFNTYTRLSHGGRDQRRVRLPRRRAGARHTCSATSSSSTRRCSAKRSRRGGRSLGGTIVGKDTFLQSDPSIAAQVTRLQNALHPTSLLLASFPAGSPALKEIRAAYEGPILLAATSPGRSGSRRRQACPMSGFRPLARATATIRVPR